MAGIRFSPVPGGGLFSRRLMMREGNAVIKNFGLANTGQFRKVPKPKFLFFVKFNSNFTNIDLPTGYNATKLNDINEGIVFPLKTIDRPKLQPATEVLHQYNKKRIIQTKIEFQPVTMTFHDDIENRVMRFWVDYYAYYYGDGGKTSITDWRPDQIRGDFIDNISGWGYRGKFKNGSANNQAYLEDITIYQFFGGKYTTITYVRPIITMFDNDQADYAEGTTGSGITMSFEYEGIFYDLNKHNITDANAKDFGFTTDWFKLEPNNSLTSFLFNGGTPFISGRGIGDMFQSTGLIGRALNVVSKSLKLPPTGSTIITNSLLRSAQSSIQSGKSIFSGFKTALGQTAFGLAGQQFGTTANLLQLSGLVNNSKNIADISTKVDGVRSSINNLGVSKILPSTNAIISPPVVINSGSSTTNLAIASSTLLALSTVVTNNVNISNTSIITPSNNEFSTSYGSAANLAVQEHIVNMLSTKTNKITDSSMSNDSVVSILPSGKYVLTKKGAAVMNSLRTPTSAVGTKVIANPWKNPDLQNNNTIALGLENRNLSG